MAAAGMCGSLALTTSPTLLRRHRFILSIQSQPQLQIPTPTTLADSTGSAPTTPGGLASLFLPALSQPAFVGDRSLSAHRLAFFGRRDLVASILSSSLTSLPAPYPTDGFLVRLISIYAAARLPDHALSTFLLINPPSERALSAYHDNRQYDRAVHAFRNLPSVLGIKRYIVFHDVLIRHLVASGDVASAHAVFDDMPDKAGVQPDLICCIEIINVGTHNPTVASVCTEGRSPQLDVMGAKGIPPNCGSFDKVIEGLCKQQEVSAAMALFNGMPEVRGPNGTGVSPNFKTLKTEKAKTKCVVNATTKADLSALSSSWASPLAGVKLSTPHHRIWHNCTGGSRRGFFANAFTARRMLYSVVDAVAGPPPVTQLMFYNQYDYDMEVWLEPENFLRRNPALYTPRTNRLITDADGKYMLSDAGKKLLRSLILLGYANHERGYCVAKSFTEGNLKVSKRFEEFALKSPICSHLNEWKDGILMNRTMTYTAVRKLFERFLEKSEGAEILNKLPQDMINLFNLMSCELVTVPSEQVIINHACMLSVEGRVGLSRRLDIILRRELRHTGDGYLRMLANRIMENMPYHPKLTNIVASHPLLSYWYNFSAEKRAQNAAVCTGSEAKQAMATGAEAQTLSRQLLGQQQALGVAGLSKRPSPTGHRHSGELLVALNRDAANHPFDAIKSVPEVAKVSPYSLKEVVELLHFKVALFLPVSQENFRDSRAWTRLAMEDFWPINPIFCQSSYRRALHVKRNW